MLRTPGASFETGRSHLTLLLVRTLDRTMTTCKRVIWWLEVVLTTLWFFSVDALRSKYTNSSPWNSHSCVPPVYWELWWDQGLSWNTQNPIKSLESKGSASQPWAEGAASRVQAGRGWRGTKLPKLLTGTWGWLSHWMFSLVVSS